MNYQQTLDYLYSQLPMFHRVGAPAYKANLDNTILLCKILGNPERKFKSIHIAGTNGKGSVSHMLASILQTAGYKTGLYTSPHLKDFRERIRINGKKIPKSFVKDFVKKFKGIFESVQPSFFEYTFGMAIEYFANENIDIAVIETGMGGRLDSTNVVNSIISVITNISLDHTQFLGNTCEKIASEKAGIIKYGVPAVIGQTQESVLPVFVNVAKSMNSSLYLADKNYKIVNLINTKTVPASWQMDILIDQKYHIKKLQCPLTGNYQKKNIITVIQTVEILKSQGYAITEKEIKKGIKNIIKNTGLNGRWQILGNKPLIICDTGHNADGINEVVNQLNELKFKNLHIILGFVRDKELDAVLKLLPKRAHYYICKAAIPRALDENELLQMINKFGLTGVSYPSVNIALENARQNAHKSDLIFIGGSTFVVAEIL